MDTLRDLLGFLASRKRYWMLPLLISLLVFAVLIGLSSGSAIAPFIYTIF